MLSFTAHLSLAFGTLSLLSYHAVAAPIGSYDAPHVTLTSPEPQYTTYNGIKVMLPVSRDLASHFAGDETDGTYNDEPLHATTLYYDRVHNATYEVQVPTAIAPPHMRVNKRKEKPGPLFGAGGVPVIEDIRQTTIPNCGWQSALGAIVHINSRWITDIASPDGGDMLSNLGKFGIHDQAAPFSPRPQKVDKTRLPDNRGDRTDVWWPSGFEGALAQMGMGPIMLPHVSLSIVTGLPSRMLFSQKEQPRVRDAFDVNGLWDLVKKGEGSPVVLQSFNEARTIAGKHAFSVIGGKEEGGRKIVTLYNPWGAIETIDLNDLFNDVYAMHILEDYPSGPNGASAPQPDPIRVDPTPEPAPTPAPQPQPDDGGTSSDNVEVVWVTVTQGPMDGPARTDQSSTGQDAVVQDAAQAGGRGRGRWNGWSKYANVNAGAEKAPEADADRTAGRITSTDNKNNFSPSGSSRQAISFKIDLSDHPVYDYDAYAKFMPRAGNGGTSSGSGNGRTSSGGGQGQTASGQKRPTFFHKAHAPRSRVAQADIGAGGRWIAAAA